MDLPKSTSDERSILRQKAEDLLRKKSQKSEFHRYDADVLKLIHELEVNQAELEMQNKELLQTISAAADAVNLYDLVPSGYFTLSNTGEIIRLNFCGANMLGKERSSLINSNFRFFISNDTLPDFNVFLGSVFQSKVKESCEVILSVDGSEPMYIQLNGIATENGEQCLLVALDITQCKLTEKKLHENQKFLKEVQMIAIHGIFSFDLAKGKWDSSEVLDLIFGIDADFDKSAENWLSIIHPEWRQVMRDFFVQEIAARKKKFEKEYQIIRQNDQAVRWVHSIARIEFDEREQPVGMVGILSDITDRKLAEEALRESEASYRLLYENSLTGIMNANPDGAIFAANPEACRMLGRTEAEICLNGRVGIVNLADLRLPLALAERARTGHFHGELTYVRADGTVFPVDVESGIYTDSKGQNHSYNFFRILLNVKK